MTVTKWRPEWSKLGDRIELARDLERLRVAIGTESPASSDIVRRAAHEMHAQQRYINDLITHVRDMCARRAHGERQDGVCVDCGVAGGGQA